MNTATGPSALARSPSSTATSKVALRPSARTDFSTTTASATLVPSLENADTVALGGSLAKLPVVHSASRSGVLMWPALRTGRLANRTADEDTPFRTRLLPVNVAPLALRTIKASERFLAAGVPIVFWAGAVMALGGGGIGAGVCAKATAGSNRPANRPAVRVAIMGSCISRPGDKREGRKLTMAGREPIFRPLLLLFNPEAGWPRKT